MSEGFGLKRIVITMVHNSRGCITQYLARELIISIAILNSNFPGAFFAEVPILSPPSVRNPRPPHYILATLSRKSPLSYPASKVVRTCSLASHTKASPDSS